ncbi:hypothetical protein [Treponema pallidum]|uniref:hypothetical protein n=1 Tax=Treponema pallidum TaxID=160 RepID=UPI00046C90E9|nr:hypothetical protein [Treponema pallidum]
MEFLRATASREVDVNSGWGYGSGVERGFLCEGDVRACLVPASHFVRAGTAPGTTPGTAAACLFVPPYVLGVTPAGTLPFGLPSQSVLGGLRLAPVHASSLLEGLGATIFICNAP